VGGPDTAPHTPHTFGPPRRSRGAPLERAQFRGGPDTAPHTPYTSGAPRRSRGAPLERAQFRGGPDTAPHTPYTSGAPRRSRGAPLHPRRLDQIVGGPRCPGEHSIQSSARGMTSQSTR